MNHYQPRPDDIAPLLLDVLQLPQRLAELPALAEHADAALALVRRLLALL